MLYDALTGQHPFRGTAVQVLRQKEDDEPPAPSAVASGLPTA
jgi:hypothetical protein